MSTLFCLTTQQLFTLSIFVSKTRHVSQPVQQLTNKNLVEQFCNILGNGFWCAGGGVPVDHHRRILPAVDQKLFCGEGKGIFVELSTGKMLKTSQPERVYHPIHPPTETHTKVPLDPFHHELLLLRLEPFVQWCCIVAIDLDLFHDWKGDIICS